MPTREEQIAAAERVAALNPHMVWDGEALRRRGDDWQKRAASPSGDHWNLWAHGYLMQATAATAGEACRALGFSIIEEAS